MNVKLEALKVFGVDSGEVRRATGSAGKTPADVVRDKGGFTAPMVCGGA